MSEFVHLHLHSEYSVLESTCRISDIVLAAVNNGQRAVAITDRGVMYGAVKFFDECKKAGIKPIIGCEICVSLHNGDRRNYHLVVLVKDDIGYGNLCYMLSHSSAGGLRSDASVDIELLREHHDGLIALSGSMKGLIAQDILSGDIGSAEKSARELGEIFGKENFYLELQDHGFDEQKIINGMLKKISSETGIPLVATNNVHYIKSEDADAQSAAMHIKANTPFSEGRYRGFETDELYFKSSDEMKKLFAEFDGAVENTLKISDKCNFEFDFSKTHIPSYTPPDGSLPKDFLKKLAFEGLQKRIENRQIVYSDIHTEDEYVARINYELFIINRMGYDEYYLVVWDFVKHAKNNFIPTGPGRGSGAGSLVAFLLGITDVDSIKYGLLFERFLNPQRVSLPDFDIDFGDEKRDDVIKYVSEKYGSDHVAQIITFGTLSARAVLHDVGRILGTDSSRVDSLVKAIPQKSGTTVTLKSILETASVEKMYKNDDDIRKLMDISLKLEGIPRHSSVHAAGVVITEFPICTYLPITHNDGMIITQYDMDAVARLGLLKFDFLALRNLTIISNAEQLIRKSVSGFDITEIPLEDEETFRLISSGKTEGVFQLESEGMKEMLEAMKPSSIEDIMSAIALYRPGPMESIPKFLEIRNSGKLPEYDIPVLAEILDSTYGCIVYQEQVMLILRKVAGYSFGQADVVRRAMSKKNADAMENERIAFVNGAVSNGVDRERANGLFGEIARFASYAFNKSHAAAYALISYRTAWLKTKYTKEYMAALLSSVIDNSDKMMRYISECARLDINILPPDVNESDSNFSVSDDGIRFGIAAVKNVGALLAEMISEERKKARYSSLFDFVTRLSNRINKKQVEYLIKSGAFDCFNAERNAMLCIYESLIDGEQKNNAVNISGQIGLFDNSDGVNNSFKYPDVLPLTPDEKSAYEKESTGFYFSSPPSDGHIRTDSRERVAEAKVADVRREGDTKRKIIKKVFLRVPDSNGEVYLKVINLLKMYSANDIPYSCVEAVIFDASVKKYIPFSESKVLVTDVFVSEVKSLIGKENIAFR